MRAYDPLYTRSYLAKRKLDRHLIAACLRRSHREPLVVTVKCLQTLGGVGKTNTFGGLSVLQEGILGSRPRVPDRHEQAAILNCTVNGNCSTLDQGSYSVPNRILYQGLQQHTRHNGIESGLRNRHRNSKSAAEPRLLNGKVLLNEGKLLRKGYFRGSVIVQGGSQKLANLSQHAGRGRGVSFQDQSRYRIQR